MTDILSFMRKETDSSQQAPLPPNSVQQRGDKCRGLLWPDAITKRAYSSRRPERCLSLKVGHRRHRLQWCREPKSWATDQYSCVLFTDEIRFSTRSDSQHVLIWREIGTRFYPSNIKERHRYGGPGVLVWGSITLNGRTELRIFDRGSVIGDRYCEEVLLLHVRLFRGAIGPDFSFMDDNAQSHWILAVKELLESEDITRIDWPAYSPDLNPSNMYGMLWGDVLQHAYIIRRTPKNSNKCRLRNGHSYRKKCCTSRI
ncbi:transposable element Tcb2 transposase [Trichonephila clavipes]|nr:transposable element Tcb2 transposase [Trichonephila clavipes]